MRGPDYNQSALYSYFSADDRVPADHPLRRIRALSDLALGELNRSFAKIYSQLGRRSVPPEQLLRALLLQVLYSIRSERMLMEQLAYNLLFRWFVGLDLDEAVWDATVFSKNRERLLRGKIAQAFFDAVLHQAQENNLLSDEHFTVDGTLLEAWASRDSYREKDPPPTSGTGARGAMLRRDTHQSKTDPDARLYRKMRGGEFQLCHLGHVLMENRSGLPVAARVTEARPDAEWEAALEMLAQAARKGVTVGADAGYDAARFVSAARQLQVTPHVAPHTKRASSIDGRTSRHWGYAISLKKRKSIERIFGWIKTTALLRKVRHRGRALVSWTFTFALATYNLMRLSKLTAPVAQT
jgi:transposase